MKGKKMKITSKENKGENSESSRDPMDELLSLENDLNQLRSQFEPEDEKYQLFVKLNDEAKLLGKQVGELPPKFPKVESRDISPDDDAIEALTDFVEEMREEKEVRTEKVEALRKTVHQLLNKLGISPTNDHQRFILIFEDVMSVKLIKGLHKYENSLKIQIPVAEKEHKSLCSQIVNLCEKLGKPVGVFPDDISSATLNILRSKANQLEQILKTNMENAISEVFAKINQLETYLFTVETTEHPHVSDDDSLQSLKLKLEKLNKYHEENKEMIELIHKRAEVRNRLLKIERKAKQQIKKGDEKFENEFVIWNLKEEMEKIEAKLLTWGGKIRGLTVAQFIEQDNINLLNEIEEENSELEQKLDVKTDEKKDINLDEKKVKPKVRKRKVAESSEDEEEKTQSPQRKRNGVKSEPSMTIETKSKKGKRKKPIEKEKFDDESNNVNDDEDEEFNESDRFRILRGKPFSLNDDLKVLRMIGASKWHAYTGGDGIWEEICKHEFPYRKVTSMQRRFRSKIFPNLTNVTYGLSRTEIELYNLGAKNLRNLGDPIPLYNKNYKNYKLGLT